LIAVDTSALVAIILGEPERPAFRQALVHAGHALISTASVVESRMVVHGKRGPLAVALANGLLRLPVFTLVPPGVEETDAAHEAFLRFGKGSGHKAALNFGDVFAYALATVRHVPLLFKGEDFAATDTLPAIDPQR